MYLSRMKATIVEALQQSFADNYPNQDFGNTLVSIEYPMEAQSYPSIWVNYDDRDSLQIASIDHREYVVDTNNATHEVTRWTFAGTVTLTAVALSSLERDNLYDELVRIYAFSRIENDSTIFRNVIESNDFIAIIPNWDQARPGGDAAAPGTPWGTDDEVIYEKSLSFDVEGEFISDASTNSVLMLSAITAEATPTNSDGAVAGPPQNFLVNDASQVAFDAHQWH